MNYRFMRIFVFFDLPMETSQDIRYYNSFRKFLIKNGFIMMQKSVYTKLAINGTVSASIKSTVKKNLPPKGLVELLEITERQFGNIEYLVGAKSGDVLDTDERTVEI